MLFQIEGIEEDVVWRTWGYFCSGKALLAKPRILHPEFVGDSCLQSKLTSV